MLSRNCIRNSVHACKLPRRGALNFWMLNVHLVHLFECNWIFTRSLCPCHLSSLAFHLCYSTDLVTIGSVVYPARFHWVSARGKFFYFFFFSGKRYYRPFLFLLSSTTRFSFRSATLTDFSLDRRSPSNFLGDTAVVFIRLGEYMCSFVL